MNILTFQRLFLSFVCILFFSLTMVAQEDSTHVVLKNGGEINVFITKVNPWGLSLGNGQTLLFKVIGELNTRDTVLVSDLMSQVDSLHVRKKGDEQILSFENAKYQQIQHLKESSASVKSALVGMQVDNALNYRFQVDFSVRALKPLIFSPSFSFGTTTGSSYSTRTYGLGLGGLWESEQTRFMLTLNVSNQLIEIPNAESEQFNPLSVISEYQFLAGKENKYILFVGGYCNINHIEFEGKQVRFGIMVGIGLNISILSFNQ